MIVLVLAGGRGSRFTASGGSGHKLEALIAGEPVLGHVLRAVDDHGAVLDIDSCADLVMARQLFE